VGPLEVTAGDGCDGSMGRRGSACAEGAAAAAAAITAPTGRRAGDGDGVRLRRCRRSGDKESLVLLLLRLQR
jgi:hypothetical protein